jgi:hypothetical protein
LKIILFLNCLRNKFGPIFQRIIELLFKKLSLSSQKYGFGIRDPEEPIPDPVVKKAPDLGSATLGLGRHLENI